MTPHAEPLARIRPFHPRARESVAGIQLAHAGRKGSTYRPWDKVEAWSRKAQGGWAHGGGQHPLPFKPDNYGGTPKALSERRGFTAIIKAFAAGARRAGRGRFPRY